MRGLTPLERYLLQRRAENAPRLPPVGDESPMFGALAALAATGRTREQEEVDPVFGVVDRSYITDLGRLALRCCPVDE